MIEDAFVPSDHLRSVCIGGIESYQREAKARGITPSVNHFAEIYARSVLTSDFTLPAGVIAAIHAGYIYAQWERENTPGGSGG